MISTNASVIISHPKKKYKSNTKEKNLDFQGFRAC
nr:MAG TPA: hypothetical protein [Caudoviricetes sp.]